MKLKDLMTDIKTSIANDPDAQEDNEECTETEVLHDILLDLEDLRGDLEDIINDYIGLLEDPDNDGDIDNSLNEAIVKKTILTTEDRRKRKERAIKYKRNHVAILAKAKKYRKTPAFKKATKKRKRAMAKSNYVLKKRAK